ncbi:MAG: hypothetical protein ACKVVT_04695 [Dehalococcoidia bacterium]
MFEVFIQANLGWQPVDCRCAAGRAVFGNEIHAQRAIAHHIGSCVRGAATLTSFRVFSAEAA